MILFEIPGDPQGKGRPRATARGGFARLYTPEKTRRYEAHVSQCAALAMRGRPILEGPAFVQLWIFVQIPQSWGAKKREAARMNAVIPMTKPDSDNIIKAVCDGMNGIVYLDDKQASGGLWLKGYADRPRVVVGVTPW